jgi:ATP-binding cassette, subfamily B, bacterial MsbA
MPSHIKDTRLYLRLLRYVYPYRRLFVVSIISMIVLAATEPAVAALIKPMLDGAFIEKDPHTMVLVPLLFVGLFVVRGLASFTSGASLHWVANKVVMDLRAEMFRHLLAFPSHYYDHHTTGRLMSKFTFDVTQIRDAATNSVTVLVRDSLAIIGLVAWMFYINWQLTLIVLLGAPFIALTVFIVRKRLRRMGRKVQESMADIHHVLGECIEGHKVVKLYGGQAQEISRFNEVINNNRRFMMKYAMAAVATSPLIQLIAAIAIASIIFIATTQATAGALSVGAFISFFSAMVMILAPLKKLVGVNEHLQRGLAACESIFELLDEPAETGEGRRKPGRFRGEIEFQNVSFRYRSKDSSALRYINLHITPGETVALVGPSGSGKTTIANLIPEFYVVNNGRILIDGMDIRECTLESLRENIALVSQDVVLFHDSIRNNIAYGTLRGSSEEEIIEAARAAHALEFIDQMPGGLDTMIGEKGVWLSGGQRQRLAIARAILKDAPILIMDEATSSLDTASERLIQSALEKLKKNRTCLIIAHRLSTIENAGRILVIDHGEIVQAGTHRELLQEDGVYARLHKVQFTEPVN